MAADLTRFEAHAYSCIHALNGSSEQMQSRIAFLTRQLLQSVPRAAYTDVLRKGSAALARHRAEVLDEANSASDVSIGTVQLNERLEELEARYREAMKRAAAAELSLQLAGESEADSEAADGARVQLHGELRRQAVEMQSLTMRVEAADRHSARCEAELKELQQRHGDLQTQHAEQAKRARRSTAAASARARSTLTVLSGGAIQPDVPARPARLARSARDRARRTTGGSRRRRRRGAVINACR